MPKEIVIRTPPPVPPKFVFFIQLVTLAALAYLIGVTLTTERRLKGIQNNLEKETGRM